MSLAFVFPGQGSQYVGMGRALMETYPIARDTLAEADEALQRGLRRVLLEGPEEDLRLTWNTQPAILALSVACFRVLQEEVRLPVAAMAGHSLGEYSALVAAGALSFVDAVRTVERRGRFMQEAVPLGTGSMAAVLGLDAPEVGRICAATSTAGGVVELANDNCPGQVVISGHTAAVEEAGRKAKQAGAKRAMPLPVSAPFHSSLMKPAADKLAAVLQSIGLSKPRVDVVANVDGRPYGDAAGIPDRLVRQVNHPVLWQGCVRKLAEMGVDRFVEVGPGKVLTGLIRRILPNAKVANIEDPTGVEAIAKGF